MSYQVEPVPDLIASCGEGPHWDIETQSLYMIDAGFKQFLRYDYALQKTFRCTIEKTSGPGTFIIPVKGNPDKFITAIERSICLISWDGISETCKIDKELFAVEKEDKYKDNRFNDGKCDLRGRLFTGTLHKDFFSVFGSGNLYRFDENGHKHLRDNITLSNGITWNDDTKKMYYIDSMDFKVREFDYDIDTGDIKNPKIIYDAENLQSNGKFILPDGITIDSEGFIYFAMFGGSRVMKVDPKTGKILLEIQIPTEQVTSVAFGGPNLDILYVTTAAIGGLPAPAGQTYRVTGLGARGLPMSKFKLT